MHVLITGGAGFIGSHLVDLHLSRGDSVHVVETSRRRRANVARHEDNPVRLDEATSSPGAAWIAWSAGRTGSTTWPPSWGCTG